MGADEDTLRIFSGNANPALAADIAHHLGRPLGKIHCTRFADGEIRVKIEESARGMDVFIVQPTCAPANDTLMELLILVDAFRRASAKRITLVIPYYGYSRQDKKIKPREPVTARLVADLITTAGRAPGSGRRPPCRADSGLLSTAAGSPVRRAASCHLLCRKGTD